MTVKFLIDQKKALSTREISDHLQIPFDTTAKILQQLNQKNVVDAEKGLHGGYVLKESIESLNFFDFCDILEKDNLLRSCDQGPCELKGPCTISKPFKQLNELFVKTFSKVLVIDLLAGKKMKY